MRKKSIRRAAKYPRHIPGIFNYCDRWCERCTFTSRCLVYAMEREDDDDPATRDPQNQAFWRKLESMLRETRDMLLEWAQQEGIDLESFDVADDVQRRREEAKEHALARAARHYAESVDRWLATELTPIEQVGSGSADMPSGDDEPESVSEGVEVIRWYQHQIGVKIMRAVSGAELAEVEEDGYQRDSDGSVKVALIGMDRSISAWGVLRGCLPEKGESIRAILLQLERLRRRAEQAFPHARSFVRPGFDSVPSQLLH